MRQLLKNPQMVVGASIGVLFLFVAVFGWLLMPNNPLLTNTANTLAPMSAQYPLGTDDLGRCVLSRLIAGCGTTLGAALVVELSVFAIGFMLGMLAGFLGKIADACVVGIIDILLAFPSLILALVIAGIMGGGLANLMIAMILVYWVEYARITRSVVMGLKEKKYVVAAQAVGSRPLSIIWRHIMPNALPQLVAYLALNMAYIIIGISFMSFIGLGVSPDTPEWGAILNDSRAYMNTNPQMLVGALVCIVLSVACFQMIGDALREALDPRRVHLPVRRSELRREREYGREHQREYGCEHGYWQIKGVGQRWAEHIYKHDSEREHWHEHWHEHGCEDGQHDHQGECDQYGEYDKHQQHQHGEHGQHQHGHDHRHEYGLGYSQRHKHAHKHAHDGVHTRSDGQVYDGEHAHDDGHAHDGSQKSAEDRASA